MRRWRLLDGRRRTLGAIVALAGGLSLCSPGSAWASAPVTVCGAGCDYNSLQDAINAASPGGTILIGAGTYQGAPLNSGSNATAFTIDKNLTLIGAGAAQTTLTSTTQGCCQAIIGVNPGLFVTMKRVTIDADRNEEGVSNGGDLILSATTVTNAFPVDGIVNSAGGLLLGSDISVTGNTGTVGGGIENDGTMALTNSTISDNNAQNGGGGIATLGTLIVNDSTISDNVGGTGDNASRGGAVWVLQGSALIAGSRIAGNNSATGGGIFSGGDLALIRTSVTNNAAEIFGLAPPGVGFGGGIAFSSNLTLLLSRVTCNTPDNLYNFGGTGTLRQFASVTNGCLPKPAASASARTPEPRGDALVRSENGFWAAASRSLSSGGGRPFRFVAPQLRERAAGIANLLASR